MPAATASAVDMEVYTLADMFRVTAGLIRMEHGSGCRNAADWEEKARLLDDTADLLDAGGQVDTSEAYETARTYLTGDTSTNPPHMASEETSS